MIWALLACSGLDDPVVEPVRVATSVQAQQVPSGEAVVWTIDVTIPPNWTATYDPPVPDELTASISNDGPDTTLTLTGPDGSYELEAFDVVVKGPTDATTLRTTPVFVDIGVDGPRSELQEVSAAQRPEPPLWPKVLAGLAGAAALMGLAYAAWQRFKPQPAPPPATPPHILALREWNTARMKLRDDDHALALALSDIFRRYAQAVTGLQATALTSSELLHGLPRHWDRERCKRLLTATDLIKFARAEGGQDLFNQLDLDLKAVLGSRDA